MVSEDRSPWQTQEGLTDEQVDQLFTPASAGDPPPATSRQVAPPRPRRRPGPQEQLLRQLVPWVALLLIAALCAILTAPGRLAKQSALPARLTVELALPGAQEPVQLQALARVVIKDNGARLEVFDVRPVKQPDALVKPWPKRPAVAKPLFYPAP